MGAPLDDAASIEDDYLVHGFQSRQSVSDHHCRLPPRRLHHVVDQRLGRRGIEVLVWFVDDEHREPGQEGPGYPESLPLASRHPRPMLAYGRIEASGKFLYPILEASPLDGQAQVLGGCVAPGEEEVFLYRRVEDVRVLRD